MNDEAPSMDNKGDETAAASVANADRLGGEDDTVAGESLMNLDEQWKAALEEMNEEELEEEAEVEGEGGEVEENDVDNPEPNDNQEEEVEPAANVAVEPPREQEEEEDPWDRYPNPLPDIILDSLPPVMAQDDPRRMSLSMEEWQVAWDIKGVFETASYVDRVSDYTIAQLALSCKDAVVPTEDAMDTILGLQTFREEYGIRDDLKEGCRALQELVQLFPSYFLHFGFHSERGTYVLVDQHSKFDTRDLRMDTNFKKFLVGFYYMLHAMSCDFESIRKGPMLVKDCGDVGWSMKTDFKILKEFFGQVVSIYPFQASSIRHYNTGVIFNLLFSMAKKALPKKHSDPFEFGYSTDSPLRQTFLVPTEELATQRVILQLQSALKRRFENARTFSLH